MLQDLIVENSARIVELTAQRRKLRDSSEASPVIFNAVPTFLAHLVDALSPMASSHELGVVFANITRKISEEAEIYGRSLQRRGYTLPQLVRAYGDICQVLTQLANDTGDRLSARDFSVLNSCLDEAVASAVTAYSRQRERYLARERLYQQQLLTYELSTLLSVATLSFERISDHTTRGGDGGRAAHAQSLSALREAIQQAVTDARHGADLVPRLEVIVVRELLGELMVGAAIQARERGLVLTLESALEDTAINGDRRLLSSAIWSLLQSAFERARPQGEVRLRATATQALVSIDVCDEAGGRVGECRSSFEWQSPTLLHDHERDDLGLAIAVRAAQAHLGDLHIHDVVGEGTVYSLELPRLREGARSWS